MKPTFLSELIIERYRYGMFHVRTSCTDSIQIDTVVKVWIDDNGCNCQEADELMGGFTGRTESNKVSQQIVKSKEFQRYVIQTIRKDYDLSRNVQYT